MKMKMEMEMRMKMKETRTEPVAQARGLHIYTLPDQLVSTTGISSRQSAMDVYDTHT